MCNITPGITLSAGLPTYRLFCNGNENQKAYSSSKAQVEESPTVLCTASKREFTDKTGKPRAFYSTLQALIRVTNMTCA